MESASTPSANEPAKDLILVHTVQLKPMTKAHFSGRMVSSGRSLLQYTLSEVCIGGWSCVCQPYIESVVALLKLATDFHLAILLFLSTHILDYSF